VSGKNKTFLERLEKNENTKHAYVVSKTKENYNTNQPINFMELCPS
jgi:hypothetical protein